MSSESEAKSAVPSNVLDPERQSVEALATARPWDVSWVRWSPDAPVMGFAIRPANPSTRTAKREVSIASLNCAEPGISAEAMYPNGEIAANAELIVKAVNSYEAMREALKELALVAEFVLTTPGMIKGRDLLATRVSTARAALALTEDK